MLEKLQERAWLGLVDTFWAELKSKATFGILVDSEQTKWLVQVKDERPRADSQRNAAVCQKPKKPVASGYE